MDEHHKLHRPSRQESPPRNFDFNLDDFKGLERSNLDQVIGEAKSRLEGRELPYHNSRHAQLVEANFHNYIDLLELSQEQNDRLKLVASLLAWYHDAIYGSAELADARNDFNQSNLTAEQASGLLLAKQLRQLQTKLPDELIEELKLAIEATTVNLDLIISSHGTQIEQFYFGQNQDKRKLVEQNLLANLLCAADVGHFAEENEDVFFEYIIRIGLELGKINQDSTDNQLVEYLREEIEVLTKYNFPSKLPAKILQILNAGKRQNIERLKTKVSQPLNLDDLRALLNQLK